MHYRVALDTFHVGLNCGFDGVDNVLKKIKKNLFFSPVPTKSKNPYYCYGWQVPDIGFNVFFDTKYLVKNMPVSIELNGKFFRNERYAEKFINWLLSEFKDLFLLQRVDACIDLIYESVDDLKENGLFFDYFPFGFPKPIIRDDFRYEVGSLEGHFDFIGGKPMIDLISSGRGEKKLRVYDKDKDILQKDKVLTYSDIYGLKSYRAFRCEYAVRSDSIKNLFKKYYDNINSYSDFCVYILSAMFKRYDFINVEFSRVFNEDVSFYSAREDSNLENQICDCLNKIHKETDRYSYLNEKAYRQKCNELGQDNLFSRSLFLKNLDFVKAYEILNKEGIV